MAMLVGGYCLLGVLFGVFFLFKGHKAIDPSSDGASFGARLIWFPAAVALWPLLMFKTFGGTAQ
ncbi:MAG: hypothetical protein AB8B48_13385 [Pseudomonadales bacterium]